MPKPVKLYSVSYRVVGTTAWQVLPRLFDTQEAAVDHAQGFTGNESGQPEAGAIEWAVVESSVVQ